MRTALSTIVMGGSLCLLFSGSAQAAAVTATGCLAKDPKGEFQLTHATGGAADHYELVPDKGVDLSAHVGHKVEITGEAAAEMSEKPNEKSAMKAEEKQKEAPHRHLKVKSLRHIAASCP